MHWKSRHIRICLAPNFSEFTSTRLKKSFPLQIAYNETKVLKMSNNFSLTESFRG